MSLATPHEGLQCGYHSKIALFHSAVISPELGWTTNHWLQWVLFSQPPACQVGLGRAEQAKEDLEEVPGFSARTWTKRKHVEMERVTMKYHEVPYG